MDQWLRNLWKNNKVFFFLLLPLILVLVFKDVLLAVLVGGARKTAEEAKTKDADLKKEQDSANSEAERLRDEANDLEGDIHAGKIDENWNRNRDN